MVDKQTNSERLSVIETKLDNIMDDLTFVKRNFSVMDERYATIDRVNRIEKLQFWLMGIIGTFVGTIGSYLLLYGL